MLAQDPNLLSLHTRLGNNCGTFTKCEGEGCKGQGIALSRKGQEVERAPNYEDRTHDFRDIESRH